MPSIISRSQLIGLKVYTMDAKYVGVIKDVGFDLNDPSNIMLIIETGAGKIVELPMKAISAVGDIVLLSRDVEIPEAKETVSETMVSTTKPVQVSPTTQVTVSQPAKQATPTTPTATTTPVQWAIPRCPKCGSALIYYPQYRRWYCPKCREYVNVSPEILARVPRCPTCGNYLSYIEQYGKWYCYQCQKYVNV